MGKRSSDINQLGVMLVDKASVLRFLTLIASILAYFSVNVPKSTLELLASVIAGIVALYVAYKNNYLFEKGGKQKEILDKMGLYDEHR